jgi:mono/diheme cytochrome c family protein
MKRLSLALMLTLAAGPAFAQPDGKAVFTTNCQACHQAAGTGIKGAFPALAGDPFVTGEPSVLTARVLTGKGGMPAFGPQLSDAEIAAVLSYIRSAWGNHAGAVTPAQVSAARAAGR